jgi:hypothetical protein
LWFSGLVVPFWVDGEPAEELAGDGVDDPDLEVLCAGSGNVAGP